MKKLKKWVIKNSVFLILGFLALLFGILYFTKKTEVNIPYPRTTQLSQTFQNLICEQEIEGYVEAEDRCDRQNAYGIIRYGATQLSEAMRVNSTDKWIEKETWAKRKINIGRKGNFIYMSDMYLIKGIGNPDDEKKFIIVNETNTKIIAFSSDVDTKNSTSTASLLLDKSKGLLMYTSINTYFYCNESLTSHTILYSCAAN